MLSLDIRPTYAHKLASSCKPDGGGRAGSSAISAGVKVEVEVEEEVEVKAEAPITSDAGDYSRNNRLFSITSLGFTLSLQ